MWLPATCPPHTHIEVFESLFRSRVTSAWASEGFCCHEPLLDSGENVKEQQLEGCLRAVLEYEQQKKRVVNFQVVSG